MESETTSYFTSRPAFPWSEGTGGLMALGVIALALVLVTLWTYLGDPRASRKRIALLIGLRLLALVLALLAIMRPSLAIEEDPKLPSRLIVAVDISQSLTVQDEFNDQTRWEVIHEVMERCGPIFEELREDANIQVDLHMFADGLREYDLDAKPDGPRTDFGAMLGRLFDNYQSETEEIRALVIVSDGADNGTERPAESEAVRWRSRAPIVPFVVGRNTTSSDVQDVAVTSLNADPSPVPIKGELTVRASINAPGFERARVRVHVLFDDKVVKTEIVELLKPTDNPVAITVDAPSEPGEIKLTLKVDPQSGEVTDLNNAIETYVTVAKEGLSVLYVDRLRVERAFVLRTLAAEERIRLHTAVRQTDSPLPGSAASFYGFDERFYDVIILGDVSPNRFTGGDARILPEIARLVREEGVGLIMLGGVDSFGGTPGVPGSRGWGGTAVADLLPVDLSAAGQDDRSVRTVPTEAGSRHYLMRLDGDPDVSDDLWKRLGDEQNRALLAGRNRLGRVKPGATVLARADDPIAGDPLLVGWDVGKGRVLAFAGDTTFKWYGLGIPTRFGQQRTDDGQRIHQRFWRQLALWLAHQEEQDGNVYVRPDFRRMPVRGKQTLRMGLRGKAGNELQPDSIEYQIVKPGRQPDDTAWQPPDLDPDGRPRVLYEPLIPGEYEVLVKAKGTDADGSAVAGEDSARFIVYPDVSDEMLRKAAEPEFLAKLRLAAAPGTADPDVARAEDLPQYLRDLKEQPLLTVKPKPNYFPDWRRDAMPAFLPSILLAFVALLGFEWGLRRMWGMK